jgi:hypothetical protein
MEIVQKSDTESLYLDPPNTFEIIEKIKTLETHDEVVNLINEIVPGWILGWPKRYSKDYSHFQNNWEFVCKKSQSKTLSVVIVDLITFNDLNHNLIQLFCDLLTLFGHSVRRKEEFIGCKFCGDAIPTQTVYNQLVDRKINVPACWMVKCQGC